MGDYTGLKEDIARQLIDNDKLSVGKVTREYNDEYNEGLVFRQSPDHGDTVEQDTKVDLWVSLGPIPMYPKVLEIKLPEYEGNEDDDQQAEEVMVRVTVKKPRMISRYMTGCTQSAKVLYMLNSRTGE